MKRCLIIAGGQISLGGYLLPIQQEPFDLVIAVDDGLKSADRLHFIPSHVVGDFDTVEPELLARYRKDENILFYTHCPEKDATDTELAMELAIEQGAEEIVILGGTGGRMDHTLANLQVMMKPLQAGIPCFMADACNRIRLLDHSMRFRRKDCFGTYISLIPLTEKVENVTLKGFKYPLHNYCLTIGNSLGISNELAEDTGEVCFTDGILICIESRDRE